MFHTEGLSTLISGWAEICPNFPQWMVQRFSFFPHINKCGKKSFKKTQLIMRFYFPRGRFSKDLTTTKHSVYVILISGFCHCSGIDTLSTADSFYNIFFLLLETVFVLHERGEQKYSLAQHLTLIWKWLTWLLERVGKRRKKGDCIGEHGKNHHLEHCWCFLNIPLRF